jgi:hypothetical protein
VTQNTQSAIAAAVAVAREQGLPQSEPVVLRDAWHILLHLKPLPIVARVSSGLPYPEGPDPQGVVRELAVAAHAARAGAAVVPPSDDVDAGPHTRRGHIVTFWRFVAPHPPADAAQAGIALRAIHDALADYDGELPTMQRADEMSALLGALTSTSDVELLRTAAAREVNAPTQPLHGDAHLGNCIGSPCGPLWHDFETACRGLREYDLAALVMRDRIDGDNPRSQAALAAYGEHDGALLDEVLPIYLSWVTASMLVALPRRHELQPIVESRLAWLRRNQAKE